MNDDLADEIEALNAIYDAECLIPSSPAPADSSVSLVSIPDRHGDVYTLQPPTSVVYPQLQLRLQIPPTYPDQKPEILDGGSGADLAREVLEQCWRRGEVCLYDLVEGLREVLGGEEPPEREPTPPPAQTEPSPSPRPSSPAPQPARNPSPPPPPPEDQLAELALTPTDPWIIAPPLMEKKSTFLAHCIPVTSAEQAHDYISALIAGDKKLQKATHNISAFRIVKENGIIVQDNDDDGETAAGSRLAHLLSVMGVENVAVVVSRWFGGVKLGPDRYVFPVAGGGLLHLVGIH